MKAESKTKMYSSNQHQNKTLSKTEENLKGIVTVKFTLDSSEEFGSAFKKYATIKEVRESLADVLELKPEIIKLKDESGCLSDSVILGDLIPTETFSKIRIRVDSTSPETVIVEEQVRKNIPTIDVITVHLSEESSFQNRDVVEIWNEACQKEWLGGYRHRLTGVEYHHAKTQTILQIRQEMIYSHSEYKIPLFFNRDTQTPYPPRDASVSTVVSRGTQMQRSDIYISSCLDKILTARPYQPYSTDPMFIEKVIIIQRRLRKLLSRKLFLNIIKVEKKMIEELRTQKSQILINQALKERKMLTNTVYPTTRGDFYNLYLTMGKWLKNEWARISHQRTKATRQSKRFLLLERKIVLLFDIEKHRILVKKEALKKEEMRFLEMCARPKTFKNLKGQITSVDDLNTQRAREYKEIYSQLVRINITPRDRIDFLSTFKHLFTSKFIAYEFSSEIVNLINREIDLISIGIKEKDLKGIRTRIEQLYLHFLRQKEFNPKGEHYRKPNCPKTVDSLYPCNRCKKLLPPSKFPVHIRMKSYIQCTSCDWLHNIGQHHADMSPYLKILRKVQHSEMSKCCYTSVCFLLQKIGMSFLTNVIWHGQSPISACQDLSRLQHVRWQADIEWSPWNTILLTDQEATCHESIINLSTFYSKSFIGIVHRRHITARLHFSDLMKMDRDLRDSGAWQNINDSGPYFHPSHADWFASQNDYDRF
uniref:IQ motif and ubiquitin-like domain-containing protein n=2 Tax=Cuerna arida TaxID=1464854 RepID=A0A1B6H340_9HEMI